MTDEKKESEKKETKWQKLVKLLTGKGKWGWR
jgi:hypothetical protein